MSRTLNDKVLPALQEYACTWANTSETFKVRLGTEGFVDYSMRCRFPEAQLMVGYAARLRIRGSTPPTTAELCPDRTDGWDCIEPLPAPRVLVVQDAAFRAGMCSLVGEKCT